MSARRIATSIAESLVSSGQVQSDREVLHRSDSCGLRITRVVQVQPILGQPVTVEFWSNLPAGTPAFARIWE